MEQDGLWQLFFETGLPEAYLALCSEREEQWEEAQTAFTSDPPQAHGC